MGRLGSGGQTGLDMTPAPLQPRVLLPMGRVQGLMLSLLEFAATLLSCPELPQARSLPLRDLPWLLCPALPWDWSWLWLTCCLEASETGGSFLSHLLGNVFAKGLFLRGTGVVDAFLLYPYGPLLTVPVPPASTSWAPSTLFLIPRSPATLGNLLFHLWFLFSPGSWNR